MNPLLLEIEKKLDTPVNIINNCIRILCEYGKHEVAKHSEQVANQSKNLALRFFDEETAEKAEVAGALHDISAVIPNNMKIKVAESLGLDILSEERECPFIIHQKLSMEIAKLIFGINDKEILSAIGCHTTLKGNPSDLDMILFISDKIKWDQSEKPPFLDIVEKGLEKSLKDGVFAFIKYLYDDKENLKVVHPWLVEAYNYLSVN